MQILIKFWPILILILAILIWFIGSRKNKKLQITNMKIWVITLSTVLILALAIIVYNFSTSDNQPAEYKRIESYGDENGEDSIKKFEADNPPEELP